MTRYLITDSGDGYSAETDTLFVNNSRMVSTVNQMADAIIGAWQHNGMDCWRCGECRPLDLAKNVPCPHCGTDEYVPF